MTPVPRLRVVPSGTREVAGEAALAPVVGLVDVTVVLPAHNEEKLLAASVAAIYAGLLVRGFAFELVIVENGSNDETLAQARSLVGQLRHARLLSLPVADYGAALAAGFGVARGTIVVSFDVDYYDMDFVDDALDALAGADVALVVASKRCIGSDDRRPALRRMLTWGFTSLLRALVGMQVSDAHGIKAFARLPLQPVLAECKLRGSLFDVEMIVRAGRQGLVAREVPASVREIRPCRSPVWRRAFEGFIGVLRLRMALAH